VTYIFIGGTPIVLVGLLAFISAFGISAEGMARIVAVEIEAATRQAAAAAGALADELSRLPRDADGSRARDTVRRHAALLDALLPGARLSVDPALPGWIGGAGPWIGLVVAGSPAGETGPPDGADSGDDAADTGTMILRRETGGALQVDLRNSSGATLICAVARRGAGDRSVVVMTEVPLSGPFVERLRAVTGIPLAADGSAGGPPQAAGAPARVVAPFLYATFLPVFDWATGARTERSVLTFRWSWAEAGRQLLGTGTAGEVWRAALLGIAIVFLGLELVALFAAFWMTRSVTGAVHDLHRATTFIDQGDFSQRVRVRSRDQLGELAQAFNDMSAHIETLLKERVERERMQRELEIAAGVQAGLFPRSVPALETATLAGECRAARGVAGDYYDYLTLRPDLVAVALGDVAGKGISASLLMSNLQASLRAQTTIAAERVAGGSGGVSVARMTAVLNDQMCRSTDINRYATLVLALYDDRSRRLLYTNAGHNAPILVRPDGGVDRLRSGGTVVGAFGDARYTEAEAVLGPGAVLVLFSDGLSEAANEAGEEYGEDRLARLAQDRRHLPVEGIRDAVFAAVDAWTGSADRVDDQTLVVLKGRTGQPLS
jgi:sigma-B regulation protein RsbU (phosphoserine phosphatase)